jgi:hypothetical protein
MIFREIYRELKTKRNLTWVCRVCLQNRCRRLFCAWEFMRDEKLTPPKS